MLKRSQLRRRVGLKAKATKTDRPRIKARSPKKAPDDQRYRAAKARYQAAHPRCEWPTCTRSLKRGDVIDLHHKAGRNGPLLYCEAYFSSLCREHHDHVETNLTWARANGWIVDLTSVQVHALRQADVLSQ